MQRDNNPVHSQRQVQRHAKINRDWISAKKIFFTNLLDGVQVTEIWRTFKRFGKVSDIVLPTKKDRFGKRFGFVVASNNEEANKIMRKAGTINFNGVPVKLDWARRIKTQQAPRKESYKEDRHLNQPKNSQEVDQHSKDNDEEERPKDPSKKGPDNGLNKVVEIEMKEEWSKMVNLSFTVETYMDLSADTLSEVLSNLGYHFVKIVKLDVACFLFTFMETEDINLMIWDELNIWIKSYSKT